MSALITNKQKRDHYLTLIAAGKTESQALVICGLHKAVYVRLISEDPDFAKQVEMARKHRAEHWVGLIAEDLNETRHLESLAVPAEKLYFDKLQYLAKADNPERYAGSGKGVNINVNLGEFKLLNPEEAKKALAADPFADAIETEYETIPSDEGDLL